MRLRRHQGTQLASWRRLGFIWYDNLLFAATCNALALARDLDFVTRDICIRRRTAKLSVESIDSIMLLVAAPYCTVRPSRLHHMHTSDGSSSLVMKNIIFVESKARESELCTSS
jgi:hypothetical protein